MYRSQTAITAKVGAAMRAPATALAVLAMVAAVAGCGGEEDPAAADEAAPSAGSTSATPTTSAAATATETRLGEADVFTCQSFVADAGEAYGWLTTLERDGTISGDLSTPGYLEVYQLGGTASVISGQQESAQLRAALQAIETRGQALRDEIDAQGSVNPAPVRQALDDATEVCQAGGFVIDWYDG
jgi:hypothetical protein